MGHGIRQLHRRHQACKDGKVMNDTLTREDWIEIYYALRDKMESPAMDNVWRKHLARIIEKIGPDGENMSEGE